MSSIRKIAGTTLAATAAAMILAGSVNLTTAPAQAAGGVKCLGINACKGQGSCKTANNACKGQNSCKGQGWMEQSSAEACTAAGGSVVEG